LAERELQRLALEDALTGLPNRRSFTQEAERALHAAERQGRELTLVMLDLDHFKRVNDQYGHNVGDQVLQEFARRLRLALRKSDVPGRWGGEEFVALLHGSIPATAVAAERVRAIVAETPFTTSAGPLSITVSAGCANVLDGDKLGGLVERADQALYLAKRTRNCVRTETDVQAVAMSSVD
jgi:two-component system cell cycle response regulator